MQVLDRCSRIQPGEGAISNGNGHVDKVGWRVCFILIAGVLVSCKFSFA